MIKHINKYKVKYGSEICETHIRNLVKKRELRRFDKIPLWFVMKIDKKLK